MIAVAGMMTSGYAIRSWILRIRALEIDEVVDLVTGVRLDVTGRRVHAGDRHLTMTGKTRHVHLKMTVRRQLLREHHDADELNDGCCSQGSSSHCSEGAQ